MPTADTAFHPSLREENANALSHAVGCALALAASPVLGAGLDAVRHAPRWIGVQVFVASMALMFGVSAFYHACPPGTARAWLRRCDHAAIYVFMAGSYTPFALAHWQRGGSLGVLGLVWAIAAAGVALKLANRLRQPLLSHLLELRQRLLWCLGAIALAFCVCYYFAADIYAVLVRPLAEAMQGAESWRDAMNAAFAPATADQVERQWKEDIAAWAAGDWRWNLMTGFDLAPARQQLERGNFEGAASALEISEQLLRDVDDLNERMEKPENASNMAEAKQQLARVIEALPDKIKAILKQADKIKAIAEKHCHAEGMLFMGRQANYPVALEGALKMKEISYIYASGHPSAELKHGVIALVKPDMPSVFIAPDDAVFDKNVSNIEEVLARKGPVIAVTTEGRTELERLTQDVIYVPDCPSYLTPILNVIPLQLLSYYTAVARGCDVDKPRNLAKSVTVE